MIIVAGGHARSVVSMMRDECISVEGVYDETYNDARFGQHVIGAPILGTVLDIPLGSDVIPAVGDNVVRQILARTAIEDRACRLGTYVSSRAVCAGWECVVGPGSCVLPLAYLGPSVRIGPGCIINTGAIVEHDTDIAEYTHVSIHAVVAGSVSIGARCLIGAGATIIDGVSICDDAIIGAGAVVASSIHVAGTYVGVPARITNTT